MAATAQHAADLLHSAGLVLGLTPDHGLKVTPASSITPELREVIRANRDDLIRWLEVGASNDPAPQPPATAPADPDRWCWPHSDARNGREEAAFTARIQHFQSKGLRAGDAEDLADRLVIRDREQDNRRTCLECCHLSGQQRCGQWLRAGIGNPAIPADLLTQLQRCDAFHQISELAKS